jgi:transposase
MTELLQQIPDALRSAFEQEWQRLEAGKKSLEAKNQNLERENKILREQIRLARIQKYGAKSEQLSDAQITLLEVEPGVLAAEVETEAQRSEAEKIAVKRQLEPRRPHPGRTELPVHLPRHDLIIACAPEDCRCTQCGQEKKIIGYEQSEELDVVPAQYSVKVVKREKRACARCEELGVVTAAAPLKIVEKCKASNRMIIEVMISKYCNHQPIFRQCASFERDAGLELSRTTVCGWVLQTGSSMEALSRSMRADLLAGAYVQADETPVGVQSDRTKGSNHRAYLWEYSRPGGPVVFDFQMGRSREGPKNFLGNYGGVLQTDGYGAYAKIGGVGITHAACMAHVRREFVDAIKVAGEDPDAAEIVAQIAELYAIEKQAREGGYSFEQRLELRRRESAPRLERLKEKIQATRKAALPKSTLGKACDYALGQWPRLLTYVSNGQVEIDNNWCENAIRPIALGRKNWLHIGSENAGPHIAAIMSVIESCRRLKLNLRDYLMDVLPKLPTWPASRVAELTPMARAAAQAGPA